MIHIQRVGEKISLCATSTENAVDVIAVYEECCAACVACVPTLPRPSYFREPWTEMDNGVELHGLGGHMMPQAPMLVGRLVI